MEQRRSRGGSLHKKLILVLASFLFIQVEVNSAVIGFGNLTRWECIDKIKDLSENSWQGVPDFMLKYVENSTGFSSSSGLKGALDGDGIFYFNFPTMSQLIWKDPKSLTADQNPDFSYLPLRPIFLYVKYYGHFSMFGESEVMIVTPTLQNTTTTTSNMRGNMRDISNENGNGKATSPRVLLPSTSNFEWGEALLEIDGQSVNSYGVNVLTSNLESGDYFLVDKLILTQGFRPTSVEEIKGLCDNFEQ